jgi:hypothetical protein
MDFDARIFKGKVVTLEKTFPTTYRILPLVSNILIPKCQTISLTIDHLFLVITCFKYPNGYFLRNFVVVYQMPIISMLWSPNLVPNIWNTIGFQLPRWKLIWECWYSLFHTCKKCVWVPNTLQFASSFMF